MQLVRELGGEASLSDPCRPLNEDHPAGAGQCLSPGSPQLTELRVAAAQQGRVGHELRGQLRRGQLERGVLTQDRLVQAPQLGPRLGADRLDQRRPRRTIGLERLGLSAGTVEREHPQTV
jgi:hypothetical protein